MGVYFATPKAIWSEDELQERQRVRNAHQSDESTREHVLTLIHCPVHKAKNRGLSRYTLTTTVWCWSRYTCSTKQSFLALSRCTSDLE